MTETTTRTRKARPKADAVLAAAVEPARRELLEATKGEGVGEHVGFTLDAERLGTHWFAATLPGYGGWNWAVTVTRAPRSKSATVCESQLLPGDGAILSPEWLPWAERLAPGDVGPGDVTPKVNDDPNLEAGFEATGEISRKDFGLTWNAATEAGGLLVSDKVKLEIGAAFVLPEADAQA